MAAPLPNGLDVSVMPQAAPFDVRNYSTDIPAAAAAFHSGLALQQEMADLQNRQSLRELEAQKIKAAKAQNDLDQALISHAQQNLPLIHAQIEAALKARTAADNAATSGSLLAGATTDSIASGGGANLAATGALNTARAQIRGQLADSTSGFNDLTSPQKIATTGIATTAGQIGAPLGATDAETSQNILDVKRSALKFGLGMDVAKTTLSDATQLGLDPL